jgi:eukaryotic-like serine/threonine-protein kinase
VDALQPGDPLAVGRYRLLNRLGTGGMGRVYLAMSPGGRLVAVKLIRSELADDPDFRRRFAQEVHAARRVGGIFAAPVVDADPDGPQPWLVTAYVDGPSLAEAVTAQGPMPVESVLTLAAGLAEGLGAVHAAGVVHRDLKPPNVLLAADGPHIIDFGISRALDAAALTNASGVVGSPGFMSPEQAAGHPVGPPTDIFSLGGVLAFAATGEPPFGGGPASALLYRVVYGSAATGNVPAALRSLVERCLAKDPADRPTTDDLLAELGHAAPADGWLAWHGVVGPPARELPATQVDQQHQDGNGAVDLLPALAPSAAYLEPAADRPPGRPPHRTRHAAPSRRVPAPRGAGLVGVALTAIVAARTAAVVAFASMSHRPRGGARHDSARHDSARHDSARHDSARHDNARHDNARHDNAPHDVPRRDSARRGGRGLS